MRPLAAHVGEGRYEVLRRLELVAQVPLLYVRPPRHCLNVRRWLVVHREWQKHSASRAASDALISGAGRTRDAIRRDVRLARRQHPRWRAFQRLGIGFISIPVLEENSITASNRGLAISLRIKSKSNARAGVEEVPFKQPGKLRTATVPPRKETRNPASTQTFPPLAPQCPEPTDRF